MAKIQHFGLKYPLTNNDSENYFLDLASDEKDKVRGQILFTVMTQKGTRIREPEFGTNLIRYIFEQNDELTWEEIKNEISDAVSAYVPNATLNDIQVAKSEDESEAIFVRIDYSVKKGNIMESDSIVTQL